MKAFWVLICVVIGTSGCGRPQPRTPEELSRAAAAAEEKPGIIDRLELPPKKARKARPIAHRVALAFADYDEARSVLITEAVRQIELGELNRAALEPLAEETIRAFERATPALIQGLNEVHALLSRQERQRLVDLVAGKDDDKTEEERKQERQDRLTKILDLNASQKTRLYARLLGVALSHWGVVSSFRGNIRDARERFVEEDFDAAELPLIREFRFRDLMELVYDALEKSLPVLSEPQRKSLAAYMDTHLRG